MELKLLTSFVSVAEHLSFVRAARQLHLSQPALSGQIQRLEAELEVELLTRNRRAVQLTDAGIVFLVEARATLNRARQAVERTRQAARGEVGRLRIGFVSSAALEIVPGIAVEFRKRFPNVTLDLMNLRTVSQVRGLLAKSLDVGFVRLPLTNDQLKVTVIHREPFVALLPKDHALASRKNIQVADLGRENFVAYGRRWAPGFHDAVIRICTDAGFSPNIVQETGEMYTAIALVAAGAGVAILPKSVVLAQSRNVVMKPLPKSTPASEIAMASGLGNTSPRVDSFLSLASTFCARTPGTQR